MIRLLALLTLFSSACVDEVFFVPTDASVVDLASAPDLSTTD